MRVAAISVAALALVASASTAYAAEDVARTLTEIEAKWSKASVTKDVAVLDGILASDWIGQNRSGKRANKAKALTEFKNPDDKTASAVNHDVSVRVFGDIALVQGADYEKSTHKGKDSSGTFTWMDVYQKRGGKWLCIASQTTKVEPEKK